MRNELEIAPPVIVAELLYLGGSSTGDEPLPELIRCQENISNATEEGSNRRSKLFGQSHVLIAPSLDESYIRRRTPPIDSKRGTSETNAKI
jgi:hypothetical protein